MSISKFSAFKELENQFLHGDCVFYDMDETLLERNGEVIDPDAIKQIKSLQERGIRVFCLTAQRFLPASSASEVIARLSQAGIDFSSALTPKESNGLNFQFEGHGYSKGVIFSRRTDNMEENPKEEERYQKHAVLKTFLAHLETKGLQPRRAVVIDDLNEQLSLIEKHGSKLALEPIRESLPNLKLFHFNQSPCLFKGWPTINEDFPDDLSSLEYKESLGGGTQSTHLLVDKKGKEFVLKYGNNPAAFKHEIIANAVSRVAGKKIDDVSALDGVKAPDFAVYTQLPPELATKLNIQPKGLFRLSEYIEPDLESKNKKDTIHEAMKERFVYDAWSGNWDIPSKYDDLILDKNGNVWVTDEGAGVCNHSLGKEKAHHPTVPEIETLRDSKYSELGPKFYKGLTKKTIQKQVQDLSQKAEQIFQTITKLSKRLNHTIDEEYFQRLVERLDHLIERFCPNEQSIAKTHAKAYTDRTSAGELTYTYKNGKAYVLLAKRRDHEWWGNFGGGSEDSDLTLGASAAREVIEESCGLINRIASELDKYPSHDLITVTGKDVTKYRMYIAPHHYVPTSSFKNRAEEAKIKEQREHKKFIWVRVDDLKKALDKPTFQKMEGQDVLEVKVSADGENKQSSTLCLHSPLYTMLQQPQVKALLTDLKDGKKLPRQHTQSMATQNMPTHSISTSSSNNQKTAEKKQKTHRVASPQEIKQDIANTVINRGRAVQAIKQYWMPEEAPTQESIETQSDIYLKVGLGKEFKPGKRDENIALFLNKNAQFGSHQRIGGTGSKPTTLNDHTKNVFKQVHEQEAAHPNHITLVHGLKDYMATKNDLFSVMRQLLHIIPGEHYHVLRALDDAFEPYANVHEFIHHFSGGGCYKIMYKCPTETDLARVKKGLDIIFEQRNGAWFIHHADDIDSEYFEEEINAQGEIDYLTGLDKKRINTEQKKVIIESSVDVATLTKIARSHGSKTFPHKGDKLINNGLDGYQQLGLSVNPFLFGSDEVAGKEASYAYFLDNESHNPPNKEELLYLIFDRLSISRHLAQSFWQLYEAYGKQMAGGLYQILIDKSLVDEMVYAASPDGPLNEFTLKNGETTYRLSKILPELQKNPTKHQEYIRNVQARLYMKPEYMHDPSKVKIISYRGAPCPNKEEYQRKLTALAHQCLSAFLMNNKGVIPNTFKPQATLWRHYEMACKQFGFDVKTQQFGATLWKAINQGDSKLAKACLKNNPALDLFKLPIPNRLDHNAQPTYSAIRYALANKDIAILDVFYKYQKEGKKKNFISYLINAIKANKTNSIKTLLALKDSDWLNLPLDKDSNHAIDDAISKRQASVSRYIKECFQEIHDDNVDGLKVFLFCYRYRF